MGGVAEGLAFAEKRRFRYFRGFRVQEKLCVSAFEKEKGNGFV